MITRSEIGQDEEMPTSEEHRRGLLRKLAKKYDEIEDAHREGMKAARSQGDLFRAELNVVEVVPLDHPVPDREESIDRLELALVAADQTVHEVKAVNSSLPTGGTAAFSDSDYFSDDTFIQTLPAPNRGAFKVAVASYYHVLGDRDRRARILSMIGAFGLGVRIDYGKGERLSVGELFEQACGAYDVRAYRTEGDNSPAQAALIPLRNAIDQCIERLWRARPDKLPLKKRLAQDTQAAKIVGFGRQLKYDSVPMATLKNLAADWPIKVKKELLTESKEDPVSEDEMSRRFLRAELFFESLDSSPKCNG